MMRTRRGTAYESPPSFEVITLSSSAEGSTGSENSDEEKRLPMTRTFPNKPNLTSGNGFARPQDVSLTSSVTATAPLPDTQPLEASDNSTQVIALPHIPIKDDAWAFLTTVDVNFQSRELRNTVFTCGRNPFCDYAISAPPFEYKAIQNFSREHFAIEQLNDKDDKFPISAMLYDKSTTGTFINGRLVGKGNCQPLVNGDIIGMRTSDSNAFRFQYVGETNLPRNIKDILPIAVTNQYIFTEKLGTGACGTVYLAWGKNLEGVWQKVAVKVIWDNGRNFSEIENETRILQKCSHPCIIGVHNIVYTQNCIAIILEYAKGGDLFDFVAEDFAKKTCNENTARIQFYQILHAIQYLHEKGVCHRDLKLDNILLTAMNCRSSSQRLKVTDFGLSKELVVGSNAAYKMKSFVGTPAYMAPEILQGRNTKQTYTEKADMWSSGCILYSLLSGSPAFYATDDDDEEELNRNISTANYNFRGKVWRAISREAKDLISKLLVVKSSDRISAKKALKHQWFQKDPEIAILARELDNKAEISPRKSPRKRRRTFDDDLQEATKKQLKINE